MQTDKGSGRINRMIIMIVLGVFTAAQILYMPFEYLWAMNRVYSLIVSIFR